MSLVSRLSVASGPELGRIEYRAGYVFAPEVPEGLHVVDARDPAHPLEIALLESENEMHDVAVLGDYAFVTSSAVGVNELQIISIENPSNPVVVGTFAVPCWRISIIGTYAFVTGGTALSIIDLSIPTAPVIVSSYDPPGDYWGSFLQDIEVVEDYAYIACNDSGVHIVDLSDIANPALVSVYRTDHRATSVSVSGDRMYVVDSPPGNWGGIDVVNISDPTSPALISEFVPSDIDFTDIQAQGDYLVAATKSLHGMRIYNVSDPQTFHELGWHNLYWYCHQLIFIDNLVYVNDQFGVAIYDISQALPANDQFTVLPTQFSLHPIYPNPFNNTANIAFDLPREVTGRLVVYDVLGREANVLYNGRLTSGSHLMQFNGNNLSSGTHFVRLETPAFTATQKATFLK